MAVVGVGQCAWDTLAVVDRFPQIDTKKEVLSWEEQGGGTLGNEMAALARLGITCRFHSVVGDDREGATIQRSLSGEGVDISGVVTRPDSRSQKAFIVIDRSAGTRTIFWNRPSGDQLRPDELPPDFLRGADFLLLDGVMQDVSLFAAREARKAGVPAMLDAGKTREWMLELARLCDHVVASEEFARSMLGWKDDPGSFQQAVRKHGLGTTTVTLGSRGSITFSGDEIISCPAFPIAVVDTTGAGDAFHAGYLYGLIHKLPLEDTVRFASAAAALACRKVGGRAGLPTLSEVQDLLGSGTPIRSFEGRL